MRKFIFFIILFSLINTSIIYSQATQDTLYQRLYYTCKVWGFLKYFHSEVAKGDLDWDSELISTVSNVKNDTSNDDFNLSLSNMIDNAGIMEKRGYPLYDAHDSLKYNLELSWLSDSTLSDSVSAKLDTVETMFRRQNNYYVGEAWAGGNPTFETDNQYYEWGVNLYPNEEYRLLSFFRYWNIINYFFPYKNIMDQNWDSTLVEFIPKIINSSDATSFHLSFLELTTRINDGHAAFYSKEFYENILGYYQPPLTLKYIENETIVTGVFVENPAIKIGDVIKSVDGHDIYTLRTSLQKYSAGSNTPGINKKINWRILSGSYGQVQFLVENQNGQNTVTLNRNLDWTDYAATIAAKGPIWKIIEADSGIFGYVDMGILEVDSIEAMFEDLWDTEAIIFDLRNYPRGTMWYMINYLFDKPIHNAKFTNSDINYPGTLYWITSNVGQGDFSKTYDKPIFILFDESTQSQAEYTVMAFEHHPKAIKIGSQTAGADGNVSTIYLPGGIQTRFSALGVFYPDYTPTQRIGIVPDIEIHPTIQGIRESRDEVLECALNHNITNIDNNKVNSFLANNFYLYQNYPNPFNPTTAIRYQLPISSQVKLSIYNILGQNVATLVNKKQPAASYNVEWDASRFSSGVYFYQLETNRGFTQTKKLILLK